MKRSELRSIIREELFHFDQNLRTPQPTDDENKALNDLQYKVNTAYDALGVAYSRVGDSTTKEVLKAVGKALVEAQHALEKINLRK